MTSRRDEAGDTLIEIIISIVLIGIISIGSFFAISMGATSSKSQRDFVTADAELRNFAEAAKTAAQRQCTSATPNAALVLTAPASPYPFPVTSTGLTCPSSVTTVQEVDITVTTTDGTKKTLSVDVRTP